MFSKKRTVIRNARILTMVDGAGEQFGDVLIDGETIATIGPQLKLSDAEELDAGGGILLPGFVDTHRHTWQTQLRSTAGNWSLYDYLVQMRLIFSTYYGPDDVYLGNAVGAFDALNAGVTTIVDHCHILNSPEHADEAIRGLTDAGIRAVFCYGIFANPKSHSPLDIDFNMGWRYEDAKRIRTNALASDEGLIRFGLAPNEPEAVPFDVSLQDARFARDLGANLISVHVAMGAYDQGHRYVANLRKAGFLLPEFLFVHGASLTDEEIAMIAEAEAGLSSTPETELQMGMGYPVALKARANGVRAGLGVDIVSNYSGDMFAQMRMMIQSVRAAANASLEAEGRAPRRVSPSAKDVLRLATLGGAEALHLEKSIGTIEVGKRADLIVIGTQSIAMTPAIDPFSAVVFNASSADVELVMVNGSLRKMKGELVGLDWPQMGGRLRRSSEAIVAKADRVDRHQIEAVVDTFFSNLAD